MKPQPRMLLRVAGVILAGLAAVMPAKAQLTFTVFTDPHPVVSGGTIGFAFAGNKFVGSVQGDGVGILYSTDLTGGNVQLFAPGVSVPAGNPASEHFVSSSLGLGGFPSRDIYVAAGNGILHITNDGTSSNMFVSGLASPVRGILFDGIGTFGNDMLVTTFGGQVYRINNFGSPTLLASVGEDTEGLDIAPLGAGFGSFDGQLIIASEGSGLLRAITPSGSVTILNSTKPIPNGPEMLSFVPLNLGASGSPLEGFYGANYTPNVIQADASQFTSFRGDVIVTSEFGDHRVSRVHWNGSSFDITVLGNFPNQPEDGIFVTPTILRPAGKFVYTNNNPRGPNSVSAFSVADDGTVTEVTGSPFATGGNGSGDGFFASNRMVALVGNFLYASNDGSNSIAGFSINPSNGVLTPVPGSSFSTGGIAGLGISMAATPNRRFLYVGSEGSRDIRIFRIGLNGALTSAGLPPVSTGPAGPDGMKASGDGRWLAAALPLAAPAGSGAVAVYSINSVTGAITPVPGSPFAASPVNGGATGVDINCASDTLFLAEATAGPQTVDVFNIDATTGALTRVPGSPFNPGVGRNSNVPLLCVQDTVLFVSNQISNTVSSYTVAPDGSLTLVAPPFTAGPGAMFPAGMAIDQAGAMLFVANFNGLVSAFTSDSLGVLTPMAGSPFPTRQPPGLESLAVFPPRTCPAQ